MFSSRSLAFFLGIGTGVIAGYLPASGNELDEERLGSIIRSELQIVMDNRPTPQFSVEAPTPLESGTASRTLGLAELKEAFRDAAKEIVAHRMASAEVVDTQPDEQQRQAAQLVLADAIAKGSWSDDDAKKYDAALQTLSGAPLAEAYRTLSVAINNGQIARKSLLRRRGLPFSRAERNYFSRRLLCVTVPKPPLPLVHLSTVHPR